MLTYCSFPLSALPHLLLGWKPDLVYVYGLVTKGLVAAFSGALRSVPFVFDIQDLWPDAVMNSGMGKPWMIRPVKAACNYVYRRASRIVVLSPGFKRALIDRGVSEAKIEVIHNWCDEDNLPGQVEGGMPVSVPEFAGRFNILFAGGMGKAQGLHAAIKAAALVGPSHPQIQFAFMGSGRLLDELKTLAAEIAPRNTLFLPRRPMVEAAQVMQAADVLLVHLRKHPLYELTIPSKTQACLAMGKPILIGVGGDAGALVERAEAGLSCEPESPESIARAAIHLAGLPRGVLQQMGRRGRKFYEEELSLCVGAERMEQAFLQAMRAFKGKPGAVPAP